MLLATQLGTAWASWRRPCRPGQHTFSNPFQDKAAFICTMTPDLYIQYFRDLGQLPLDQQGMLNPADIARTMARYATDVVHPS